MSNEHVHPIFQNLLNSSLAAQKEAPDAQCHPAACRDEMLWRAELDKVWAAAVEACARIVEQVSAHNVTAKEWDEARNATQEIRALKRARPASQTKEAGK